MKQNAVLVQVILMLYSPNLASSLFFSMFNCCYILRLFLLFYSHFLSISPVCVFFFFLLFANQYPHRPKTCLMTESSQNPSTVLYPSFKLCHNWLHC